MIYRAIGLMSGSSLDGLDIVFTELEENRGGWNYSIKAAACYKYDDALQESLASAKNLSAKDYFLLHVNYAKYLAESVNKFIKENNLYHQVQLIALHGHTVFHEPSKGITTQLGCGATLAALTHINVVSDLRIMDVALGGEGAPIVPLGEKLLFQGFDFYINLGGIANVSFNNKENFIAFDVCAANRILNMLADKEGKDFDEDGLMAESGSINEALLLQLQMLDFYKMSYPKSLSNNFGTETVYPLLEAASINTYDALRTYCEHIALQIQNAVKDITEANNILRNKHTILVTGGGAFNSFLISLIKEKLQALNVDIVIPAEDIIQYKEALIMALLGVLRWREENTVMNTATGASRSSIGGAVWIGQDA